MYELVQVGENSFYIQCPAKIGLYRLNENEVCIIDSGNDKNAGRKVRQILDKNGWKLKAIFNTHSHADHIGGNLYLQKQTGCKIYASGIECDFINNNIFEPAFLYGGCPPKDLRHKFLMAEQSRALPLDPKALPEGMEIIDLKGHSFDMVGFRTPDDVLYIADCLSSYAALEKYGIVFLYDPAAYVETLKKVQTFEGRMFVPAHAEAAEDVRELAQANIDKVCEICISILEICSKPACFEYILKMLFEKYKLEMTFEQYVLVGSTVRSYIARLRDEGRLNLEFKDSMMYWTSV